MVKCRKCGVELHPDQRACLECGTLAPAGGGFDYGEEKKPLQLTRNQLYGLGGVILLVIIILIARGLRTIPPDKIASEWFSAMSGRAIGKASKFVTPNVEQDLSGRMMDLRAIADEYSLEVTENKASFQVAQPVYDNPSNPKTADVTVTFKYPDGQSGKEVKLQMVKQGRRWLVNSIM